MTAPSDPLVFPDELGVYLSDPSIDLTRAALMIELAQSECERVAGTPLPATARIVVMRVAQRGYITTLSPRKAQQAAAGSPYGGVEMGGIYLTEDDRNELLGDEEQAGPEAFTIRLRTPGQMSPYCGGYGSFGTFGYPGIW